MRAILFTLSLFICANCFAQDKKWTLQECMKYAVENNPKVNKQNQNNSIHHQNYLEAIGRLLPSLNAGVSTRFTSGRAVSGNDNSYVNVNALSNGYDVSSSLTLFDGLANINTLKMQRMNKAMGKLQLQTDKDEIAYATMEAYMNVIYYKEMVRISNEQLGESQESLRQIERMEELGLKSFPDVAEAKAKEAEDAYKLTQEKNKLTIGFILLKEKMNFPIDQDLLITDYYTNELVSKTQTSAIDIYNSAIAFLPVALVANKRAQAGKLSYRASKGSLLPTISLEAGYGTNFYHPYGKYYPSFHDQFVANIGKYVGLSFSLPIFNGFSQTAKVKRSKANMIIAETEKEETLRKLYSDIEQAVVDMNGQVDEYNQAKKQTEAMQVAHDVNLHKYKEGLVSALDVSTSSNRATNAKVQEVNALFIYYLKQKMVDYYKGVPFIQE